MPPVYHINEELDLWPTCVCGSERVRIKRVTCTKNTPVERCDVVCVQCGKKSWFVDYAPLVTRKAGGA